MKDSPVISQSRDRQAGTPIRLQTMSQWLMNRTLLDDDTFRRSGPERLIRLPETDLYLHSVLTTSARRLLGIHNQLINVWIDLVASYAFLHVTKTELLNDYYDSVRMQRDSCCIIVGLCMCLVSNQESCIISRKLTVT